MGSPSYVMLTNLVGGLVAMNFIFIFFRGVVQPPSSVLLFQKKGGFHSHGGSPIFFWFIIGKSYISMDDWWVPLF